MAAVFRPVATLSRIQMATMAPSAERGPTMKRSMDWIIISMQPPFSSRWIWANSSITSRMVGTAPSMPSMMRPPALRGSGTEMMSLKVMVPVTSPRSTPVTMP